MSGFRALSLRDRCAESPRMSTPHPGPERIPDKSRSMGNWGWGVTVWIAASVLSILGAFALDGPVKDWVRMSEVNFWRRIAGEVSFWGDFGGVIGFAAALWLWAKWSKNVGLQGLVVKMGVCGTFSGLLANVIRVSCGRARPFSQEEPGWYGILKGLKVHDFQSFPSAHTAVIAGFVGPLLVTAFRKRFGGESALALVFALASLVTMAWARVRVGQHHLSDVVASAWLGVAFSFWWMNRYSPEISDKP